MSSLKKSDKSNGWEAIANEFLTLRNLTFGKTIISSWAKSFESGQSILDVGCGFGGPYTQVLIDCGLNVFGIDASPSLLNEYSKTYPNNSVRCEAAEESNFFDRKFDGVISIGLMFLLSKDVQVSVLEKIAQSLNDGGKLLFTSPYQVCDWDDLLTGRQSVSLGRERYVSILKPFGLELINEHTDEGKSHYYEFSFNGQ